MNTTPDYEHLGIKGSFPMVFLYLTVGFKSFRGRRVATTQFCKYTHLESCPK